MGIDQPPWKGTLSKKTYMPKRVDEEISYYENQSKNAKRWFQICSVGNLFLTTLTAIVAGFGINHMHIAIMSGIAALLAGLLALFGWHQLWLRYRTAAEALKREKHLFSVGAKPYQSGNLTLFAEKCERIISMEHRLWIDLVTNTPASGKKEHN